MTKELVNSQGDVPDRNSHPHDLQAWLVDWLVHCWLVDAFG